MRRRPDPLLITSAIILLLAFLILPALLLWADANLATAGKSALIPLVLINPVVFLVLSLLAGRRLGARAGLFIAAALVLFALSALLVYNSSALVYILVYLPLALIGWGIGVALRRL